MPIFLFSIVYLPTRQYILTNNGSGIVAFNIPGTPSLPPINVSLNPSESNTQTVAQLGNMGNNIYGRLISGVSANIQVEISLD